MKTWTQVCFGLSLLLIVAFPPIIIATEASTAHQYWDIDI